MKRAVLLTFFLMVQTQAASVPGILSGKEEVTIKTKSQGEVSALLVHEGEWVESGKALAVIDDNHEKLELEQAKLEYHSAEREYQNLEKLKKFLSQDEYELKKNQYFAKKTNLGLKELNLNNTKVVSPITGLVGRAFLKKGMTVGQGERAFDVVNVEDLVIELNLKPEAVRNLKTEQELSFTSDQRPGQEFRAKATFISPVIDKSSGTIRVKLELKNAKDQAGHWLLTTGTMVNVSIPE